MMPRPRLVPCLLIKNGLLVRSQQFEIHQFIGNPMSTIERFSHWNVDELVLLDISTTGHHDLRRNDIQQKYDGNKALDVLREVAKVSFMPLAFGGGIKTMEDIRERLNAGADKCVINTAALHEPAFITEASRQFGAQCVVISIDCKQHDDGSYEVFADHGNEATGLTPAAWAKQAEEAGAGEIFLNHIDRDGMAIGYDTELIRSVVDATTIPVIACGGVGSYDHFAAGIEEGGAQAVSAANIFHFFEVSYPMAKQRCIDMGLPMRPAKVGGKWFRREPVYEDGAIQNIVADRLAKAEKPLPENTEDQGSVSWCTSCAYPSLSAVPLDFNEAGECTGCQVSKTRVVVPQSEWDRRKDLLGKVLEKHRSKDGSRHDCVIAVSGGKDSYFITHVVMKEFGINPLLVTYNGNNWTPQGWENMLRMKEVFGCDHLLYSPPVDLLTKLNRLAFIVMGDMNWHCHVGIATVPVRVAAQQNIPLVMWGEHGYADLGGQFSMNDFHEMSYRNRQEHFARGYEWNFFVGMEGITAQQMLPFQYPSDQTLFEQKLRGIYLGNYVPWNANEHAQLVMDEYGWKPSPVPFERTYRKISNLDDMHENGMHDYLKFIKFGYGRCTDHVCKDIRSGKMTREEGVELIRQYDHVKSSDLQRWLDYTGMTEDEFDRISDTFRDSRVWSRKNGQWFKRNIWD